MANQDRARPAGDVDYARHGVGYATQRRTDPRIAAVVHDALGASRTVLNVGAGAGSYEPLDRHVVAVEPSRAMRAQRPAHLVPAIDAVAEKLPFDDDSFDAAMAMVTVHQWADIELGLREMRRVTRGPVVILTGDGKALDRFWLAAYAPEQIVAESRRCPKMEVFRRVLGEQTEIRPVAIPIDCTDGFTEAFYARPERLLDPAVRRAQSSWTFVEPAAQERAVAQLGADLESGAWDARYGEWRRMPCFEGSFRLVVSNR